MEKYFERSILDELYEAKVDDFAESIYKEIKKRNINMESVLAEEKLTFAIKKSVKDEKLQKEIFDKLNEYELKVGKESDFWNRMYYKLGVYDCSKMKEIVK